MMLKILRATTLQYLGPIFSDIKTSWLQILINNTFNHIQYIQFLVF